MLYRKIGGTSIDASVVGLGTFPLGGWMWGGLDRKAGVATIRAAWDSGINLVDTAPLYGYGVAEELLGEALRGYAREQVVISTKCGLRFDQSAWPEGAGEHHFYYNKEGLSNNPRDHVCRRYLRAESIIQEAEESLKRLGTDYIDVYFTHAQEETTPLEETISALTKLKEQGKIRAIGCSNVTMPQMRKYLELTDLSASQERFNLIDRTMEKIGLTDLCVRNNVSFFAYSPLENGLLTGTMTPGIVFPTGDLRQKSPRFCPDNVAKANTMLDRFRPMTEKYHISVSQLVIAWTFARISTGHVLCGMRNTRHVASNAEAGSICLTPDEIEFMASESQQCTLAANEINEELNTH
ncbi:MAG: aldo/keto reductase [Planctomycetia bacterium]|nr:aldo/keto reductase [Planctomycetia bacterium]